MRRAEKIYARCSRRMLLGYLPTMLLLLVVSTSTAGIMSGLSVLAQVIAFGLALSAVCDLFHSEAAANAADRAEADTSA